MQTNQAGIYSVLVSNVAGSVTSSNATLTVNFPPVISSQPTNQTATVTSNVTFSVVATGNPAPTYQWRFGASNLAGATNSSFTRTNVQTNQAGIYSVLVSNVAGSVTSSNATLTVNTPPVFTLDPMSQTSNIGATVVFTAAATGSPPVTYQWRFGGLGDIAGQTNTSLTVTNVQTANAGNYRVVASNIAGSVMSAVAVLTVNAPPVITQQPLTQTVAPGSNPALTVVATGTPTPTYQWRFNATNLPGETAAMLTLTNFQTSLWLPAADGGLFEIARGHVSDLADRAEANGDPHANVRLARQKLADSDANAAAGRYERACMDLSEGLRAISPQ